ncbi:unnamed protein product [Leptidea sinapis]|uniref:Uncharacterized protein n=1 Tax=Leptidea sinapis TaxID=189913 RepID=A0A5E4QTV6_9NEOP|nr:unnamed protein product [Leptidea sinapis]
MHYRSNKWRIKTKQQDSDKAPSSKVINPKSIRSIFGIMDLKLKLQRDIDSDDEEEFDEGDKSLSKDSKVIKLNTTSLRADGILKLGLGIRIDDEVDLIKGFSPKNPDHILISRIEVLNIAAKEESISVTVRRFKNLLIENYEQDPYKKSSTDDEE